MKFNRIKKPKTLYVGNQYLEITSGALVKTSPGFGSEYFGPRQAVRMAEWLMRYALWSSLKTPIKARRATAFEQTMIGTGEPVYIVEKTSIDKLIVETRSLKKTEP